MWLKSNNKYLNMQFIDEINFVKNKYGSDRYSTLSLIMRKNHATIASIYLGNVLSHVDYDDMLVRRLDCIIFEDGTITEDELKEYLKNTILQYNTGRGE